MQQSGWSRPGRRTPLPHAAITRNIDTVKEQVTKDIDGVKQDVRDVKQDVRMLTAYLLNRKSKTKQPG